jgi:hypothetical protein
MSAAAGSDEARDDAVDAEGVAAEPRAASAGWARARAGARRPLISYVIVFVLALGFYHHAYGTLAKQNMTGDEPTYMLDALSMARDGDRDLSNQYSVTRPQEMIKLFGIAFIPHVFQKTSAGQISWHGAGVGLDVVPAVWVGDWQGNPIRWVRLELVLIDALAALALFAVLRRVAQLLKLHQAFAWVAWASAALSFPLVVYSDQLYPEVPALLCVLLGVNAALRPRPRWWVLGLGSIAVSYLPWLHVRFIPVCLALLAVLAVRGLSAIAATGNPSTGPPANRLARYGDELRGLLRALTSRAGLKVLAAVAIPALVSFISMAIEFQRWYGSPSWTITAGTGGVPALVTNVWYPAVLGGLFGTDYGWVPWAPVGVLAIAAIGCLILEAPRWGLYALLIICGYQAEIAFSGIASPGFVFPGRYEIICIPLLSVALLVVLARLPVAWLAFIPLMLATIAISWQAADQPGHNLLNTGAVGLPMAAHITSAFPDVEASAYATTFVTDPVGLAGNVGRLVERGKVRRAVPKDGPGYLLAGPRIPLRAGAYIAHFLITQRGGHGDERVAELQAWSLATTATLGSVWLTARDLPPGKPTEIDFPFGTPGGEPIESRVYVTGKATIEAGQASATAVAIQPTKLDDQYPDGSLMAAWVGGTVFLGALLTYALSLKRRIPKRDPLT